MTAQFLYGTLCHPPLLEVVLGRVPLLEPAMAPGWSSYWVAGAAYPTIEHGAGACEGVLIMDLCDEDILRMDFYEGGFGYQTKEIAAVTKAGRKLEAHVYMSDAGALPIGDAWVLADWEQRWGQTVVAAAQEFMAQFGASSAEALRRRYPQMLVRGGSRVRAEALRAGTETLRRSCQPGDTVTRDLRHPYAAYFSVEEYALRYRRFDGEMSAELERAAFISGDASIVLPYDPIRDRVMVIEQFRVGPYARGDANPWLIEAIAGRVDGGESPQEAARREAVEEAGLVLQELIAGPNYYPSPGAKAEYLYSFVGITDLPDGAAGMGGLEDEAEDIRSHVIPFAQLMALIASGEVNNAPLIILAYWLDGQRQALRAGP
ncbi:MAG: gamma-glutamylcyclotransferase [Albidovulum sp.]